MTPQDQQPDAVYEDFDEVFGSAIDVAVRRAIDRVGREPMGDLEPSDGGSVGVVDPAEPEPEPAAPSSTPDPDPTPDVNLTATTESAPPGPGGLRRERLEDRADDQAALALPRGRLDGVNPYAVLGVSPSASWEQIAAAYRRRARAWHPDGAEPEEAARRQELIRQLNAAYSKLRALRQRRLH